LAAIARPARGKAPQIISRISDTRDRGKQPNSAATPEKLYAVHEASQFHSYRHALASESLMSVGARSGKRQGAVRIIGGRWRSRRLQVPPGTDVRPTPDRVRETLFNWLEGSIAGARCLDLFAGTGALGLEALSRGAREVVFVERDPALADALRAQVERLETSASVVAGSAEHVLQRPAGAPFDIVFLDPPYEVPLEPLLALLPAWLAPGAVVYLERHRGQAWPDLAGFGRLRKRSRAGRVSFGLAAREA
jgi:16S rRNA (guanine966-N2)-methyltransferase